MKDIRNKDDYKSAQSRVDELTKLITNSKEFNELGQLLAKIKIFETLEGEIPSSPVEAIKNKMIEKDIKQNKLALILKLDAASLSRILKGERGLNYDIVKKLHKELEIPYEHLF
ncbi:Helix-turn-helix domain protein [Aliarcobacter thereius]|uniref:Helix-turn-helix domain protein n=1 Tax=Aliarcobacter thereius TaxID=544718 RepID=A0A1C0B697_9BACT|nr:helix-turn-helix domain-containing protein [Aliarcobacter thereius]OCL98829.1 Helix-turn-helix domain protein [Aliarcobacter thereius]